MTTKLTDKQIEVLGYAVACPKCLAHMLFPVHAYGDKLELPANAGMCCEAQDNEGKACGWTGSVREAVESMLKRAGVEVVEPGRFVDLAEEVDMLRQSLKDARRALAMTRGEEWPDDWHYDDGTLDWWSPTWSAVIRRVEADNGGILWDMRVPYPQGWVSVTPMPFPDPLAALRAFEAGGF